jgi:hypothetical protein
LLIFEIGYYIIAWDDLDHHPTTGDNVYYCSQPVVGIGFQEFLPGLFSKHNLSDIYLKKT